MEGRTVLVVDDDDGYREGLVRSLREQKVIADGARSGEEAVEIMDDDPQRYQYAVIDHYLGTGMNGIDTTKELVDRNQNLFALVFTNVLSDNKEDIARFKYEALSAGAYRYLERSSEHEAPKQVTDFISEIEQLASLSSWIRNYYESREHVPSLLTQLNIGVYIVDRSYKVWFMNNAMHRIIGLPGQELPKKSCPMWHGYCFSPCMGCLVHDIFKDCEPRYKVFLSPLVYRDRERLFYMNVWTQPIMDQDGKILRGTDGKPLAVMESVQELTGTAQLREMSLDRRLDLIADAFLKRPVEGSYLGKTYFDNVEIHIRETGGEFILRAAYGFYPPLKLGVPVDFSTGGYLQLAEDRMKEKNIGYYFHSDGVMKNVIYWPVLEDGRTIAVLRVSGSQYCNEDSVKFVRPYAEEVQAAISDAQDAVKSVAAEAESDIANVDFNLQTVSSPREALQTLVSSACELTDSYMAVLRYRDGDDAVLLNLNLEEYSGYEKVAQPRYPLSYTASWSSRTIISGQECIANMTSNKKEIERRRCQLHEEARKILDDFMALCFEPLLLEGRCIGALGLYSRNSENYSDPKKLQIIRAIARRTAIALHDYTVDQKAQKRVEDTQYETIGSVLHNINTPLGTTRYILDILKDHLFKNYPSDEYAMNQLEDIVRQTDKIARIREEFLKLRKDWEERIEETNIHELLHSTVDEIVKHKKDVSLEYNLDDDIKVIKVDTGAIVEVLEVLVKNSLDELEHKPDGKKIRISLRPVLASEFAYLSSSTGLAIDVEDNGSGVPSDMVKDLFNVIRSGKAKGLGFGLTYCRRVARSAHGDVYYHDEYKDGAKFTLVLPYEPV